MLEQNNVLIGENAWEVQSLDALTLLLSPEFVFITLFAMISGFPGDIGGANTICILS